MTDLLTTRSFAIAYFVTGALVCFVHPLLLRKSFRELMGLELGAAGIFLKPLIALLVCLLYCVLWPIAWFNAGKSENRTREALGAQLERLRPFQRLYSAMNAPVIYAGGNGSSFDQAVIIEGATLLSSPRAEYDFIERHYPGYEFRQQSLKEYDGRSYDVLEFTTAAGESKVLYFDISGRIATPEPRLPFR